MKRFLNRWTYCTLLILLSSPAFAQSFSAPESLPFPVHPLDPLTANEIDLVRQIIITQANLGLGATFWTQLHEPSKMETLQFRSGSKLHRQAEVVAVCPQKSTSFAYLVDLDNRRIVSTNALGILQPALSNTEFNGVLQIIDQSPEIRAALQKRGYQINGKISDRFYLDLYAPGRDSALTKDGKTIRAVRVLFADRQGGINSYGPYVEGLMALVDVFGRKVILPLQDIPGAAIKGSAPGDIFNQTNLGPTEPKAELQISPQTITRLKLQGHHARWENWDFRFSFNQREGLVLHEIAYRYAGKLRPICYRAAISEMLVPYSDPSPAWAWREFFDAGEYGLGCLSVEARPGKELPANAMTLSAILPDESLHASDYYQNRLFFYERDGGLLLAHTQGPHHARIFAPGKELVVGFMATIGNYDYTYKWVFREDGSFRFEADLQGIILDKTIADQSCSVCSRQISGPGVYEAANDQKFGALVSPQIDGVFHQHWMNLRLDFDVDGTNNAVEERNVVALPPDPQTNPRGRAFTVRREVFGQEREAERSCAAASNRVWVIYNPQSTNALGHFAGYEIDPDNNAMSSIPESRFGGEASFTQRHFWATRFHPSERYAAGDYPNQSPDDSKDNLFYYADDNEGIYNQDIVVWYSLGFTHIPRPEDYPIMPAGHVGVNFQPSGFFSRNPALGYATIESDDSK